ncbi:glycosyltransferase family 61 protein [Hymenobacter caeli]|uniref:Glycosyltransferase 61 catalytic domain-containing protein n=1 Tax=Hymenobacter caeli TaxID=2735894 RepID=A0ABX2FLL3_9BACT|nr:glycosyltransferase family 61 protein [Hymenobacter caeli]NRT18025.1 hypothetical protein [Hymenobacter caeli]
MNRLVTALKNEAKGLVKQFARLAGFHLLTKAQTVAYLKPHERVHRPAELFELPDVYDAVDPGQCIFQRKDAATRPCRAWYHTRDGKPPAALLRNGSVWLDGNVLCTDYFTDHVLKDSLKIKKRTVVEARALVAPFSHYLDPVFIWGYYDFMFLIAAKLCRMAQAVPELAFSDAVVAYPLFGTTYEREFLSLLGFSPAHVLDSRLYNVQSANCLLANAGSWYYPSPKDVELLRNALAPLVQEPAEKRIRLYVSRAGRRRIENEAELVAMLERHGFTVMEDRPRTLAEQLTLYHRASFIVGPHGASFSNIIWCQPGAHLFEIFAPDYAPDFFLYLAQLAGVGYSACCQPAAGGGQLPPIERNIRVAVADVERGVVAALAKAALAMPTR